MRKSNKRLGKNITQTVIQWFFTDHLYFFFAFVEKQASYIIYAVLVNLCFTQKNTSYKFG